MKSWIQFSFVVTWGILSVSAQGQTLGSREPASHATEKKEPSSNASLRWKTQWEVTIPDSRRAFNEQRKTIGEGESVLPTVELPNGFRTETYIEPRTDSRSHEDDRGFPRSRLDFERRFEPTRDYDNPIQQTISQWFYRTNDLIYTWYGGFFRWQRDFDVTMNQVIFGRLPSAPKDETFFGQPRLRTKLEPSSATIRIDVPFGR